MPEEDLHLPDGVRFQAHVRFAALTSTLRFGASENIVTILSSMLPARD